MTFTQTIKRAGFDFSTMPRGFKEELAYIEGLTKKIQASEFELDEDSDEDEKQTIANAKESLEERKAEFFDDLKELREAQKAKQAPVIKVEPKSAEVQLPLETEEEKKDSPGIAGYIVGGIALLATFGAINYFKRR